MFLFYYAMIKIQITKQNDKYLNIDISGHANSNEKGKDLVCAGVSAIIFGIANALENLPVKIIKKENNFTFNVEDLNNEQLQIILNTLYIQLLTIYTSNKKYIQIDNM